MFKKKVYTIEQQCEMLIRCGQLLERGYSIQEIMYTLKNYSKGEQRLALNNILDYLYAGNSFYEAIREQHFSKLICESIYIHEYNGNLADGCKVTGKVILHLINQLKKLRNKFFYPLFLFVIVVILFLFIRISIYPNFEIIYKQQSSIETVSTLYSDLPMYIFLLLLLLLFIGLTLIIGCYCFFRKRRNVDLLLFLSKFPVIKHFIKNYLTYYFSYQLFILLQAGISLQQSLHLLQNNPTNKWLAEVATIIIDDLMDGISLVKSIEQSNLFLLELSKSIDLGNKNSRLLLELQYVSEFAFDSLNNLLEKFIKLVQPISLIMIATIIISLYLSILLPILQLMEAV